MEPTPAPVRRLEIAALAAILILAVEVRLVGLSSSLWYDEVLTLVQFVRLPTDQLVQTFSSLNNHMFYSLQAQASVAMLGETPWGLRLPAVLFGVASLALVWRMARQIAGRVEALACALLLALSYHHVWFSQNARGYTGLLFWTLAATLLFVRNLKSGGLRGWSAYAVCVALAMYTHLSAGFFFAAHGAVYLALLALSLAGPWKAAVLAEAPQIATLRPVLGIALGGMLTAILHLPLASQVLGAVGAVSSTSGASAMAEWNNPLRTLQEVAGSLGGLGPLGPPALIAALVLIGVGAASLARRAPVLTAIYLVHIPLCALLLAALSFRIWPRYFLVDLGALYTFLVHGVFVLGRHAARLTLFQRLGLGAGPLISAAVLVMLAGSTLLLVRNYVDPKQDLSGAAAYVARHHGAGQPVGAVGLAALPFQTYYAPGWASVQSPADLRRLQASAQPVWLVVAFPHATASQLPAVARILTTEFEDVRELPGTLGDGYVHVYRERAELAAASPSLTSGRASFGARVGGLANEGGAVVTAGLAQGQRQE